MEEKHLNLRTGSKIYPVLWFYMNIIGAFERTRKIRHETGRLEYIILVNSEQYSLP